MANPRISVKGIKELASELRAMGDRLGVENMRQVFVEACDIIRAEAARNVEAQTHPKTGNLLKSLVARAGKNAARATAWVKAGGRMAPHAHLIEYGHAIVGHKPNKTDTGKRVAGRPFFRTALDAKRSEVRNLITERLRAIAASSGVTGVQIGRKSK